MTKLEGVALAAGISIAQGRAAVEALLIPTNSMLDAGRDAGSPESPALPHEVWPVMVEAILNEKPV